MQRSGEILTDPDPRLQFIDNLTPTEHRCLLLVAEGLQSKEIASVTGRAPKTIDKHLENACRKLGVHSRRQAARLLISGLRSGSVGGTFPLATTDSLGVSSDPKGGSSAAEYRSPAIADLVGDGGHPRGSGGDGGAGDRSAPAAVGDPTDGDLAFTARLDARDFLHRARSPLRERSTAPAAGPAWTALQRLALIPTTAALVVALIAAILGGAVQMQLAVQAIDRLLSGS